MPLECGSLQLTAAEFEEPRTLQEHLHSNTRWVRTAFVTLSVAGLIGLLAASGCINPEVVETSSHESAAEDSAAASARRLAAQNLKPAIAAPGDVLIAGGVDASNQSIASAEFFNPSSGQFVADRNHAVRSRGHLGRTALADPGAVRGRIQRHRHHQEFFAQPRRQDFEQCRIVRRDDRRILADRRDGHAANGVHRDRVE